MILSRQLLAAFAMCLLWLLCFGCASAHSLVENQVAIPQPNAPSQPVNAPPFPPAIAPFAPQPLVVYPVHSRTITLTWENHFTATNQVAIVEATDDLASHRWTRIYTGLTNTITGQVDAPMQFYRAGNLALNQITN